MHQKHVTLYIKMGLGILFSFLFSCIANMCCVHLPLKPARLKCATQTEAAARSADSPQQRPCLKCFYVLTLMLLCSSRCTQRRFNQFAAPFH